MVKIALLFVVGVFALIAYRLLTGQQFQTTLRRRYAPALCGKVGHSRSARAVRKDSTGYVTRCSRCGVRMTKPTREDEWQVAPFVAEGVEPVGETVTS